MEDLDYFAAASLETRIAIDQRAVEQAAKAGVLDIDEQRARPRYQDGQLLGADGFRRDQALFDRRQHDLGTLVERGVVAGLEVRQAMLLDELGVETDVPNPSKLTIAPGHGVTGTGEAIVLGDRVEIDLTEFPVFERLDATFALDRQPREPARTQSGVFVLTLRTIRYTANPVAPYPSSITGERRLEDGDVIDASAVTLVPIDAESSLDGVDAGPSVLARRIFAEGLEPLVADDALPIAVVALARGQIAWIDVNLGRRQALADPSAGYGAGHRALLDAHAKHFEARMAAILERRVADGLGARFAATDYFEVLPPSGSLPPAAVSVAGDRLLQWFFPSTMETDLALVPDDELPALMEEAMHLGPLSLTQGAAALEATPMMILIPVARDSFMTNVNAMGGIMRQPMGPRLGSYAYRRPVDAWQHRFRRPALSNGAPTAPLLIPWETALGAATTLYFVRQRRRARTPFALARYGPMPEEQRPSRTLSQLVFDRIDAAGELERFDRMLATAGVETLERLESLFTLDVFGSDPLFVNGVIAELSSRARRRLLEPGTVTVGGAPVALAGVPAGAPAPLRVRRLHFEEVDAIARRYEGDGALGDGMVALRNNEPDLTDFEVRLVIAQSLRLPELDLRVRTLPTSRHPDLAASVLSLSHANDVNGIRDLVGYIRAEPPPLETPRMSNGTPSTGFANAVAIDQGGLFALLWAHADDGIRQVLDALLTSTLARQPLASVALMTTLCRLAWATSLSSPQDVQVLLEHLYRWPFTPEAPLRMPGLSVDPELSLVASNPQLTGFLNLMAQAETELSGLPFPVDQATAELEAAGFPGDDVELADAYRVLGCAFNDLTAIRLTGAILLQMPAEFPAFVAALSVAVAAADIEAVQAIRAEWEARF